MTATPHHINTEEFESLTHIEIDVANTYQIKAIPVESTRIRTGGSLSFRRKTAKCKEHSAWQLYIASKFRFQDLKIRQFTIEIANEIFDIGDELERRKLYRFADQLRGAGMPMSNNIAEGLGSNSTKEFRQYLNIAQRSPFENVNILILLKKRNFITKDSLERLLDQLAIFVDKLRTFKIL